MKLPSSDVMKSAAILGGVLIVGFVGYKFYRGAVAVGDAAKVLVTEKLNPASDKNIVYDGVNAALQAVTGQKNQTLGGWIYDVTHRAKS